MKFLYTKKELDLEINRALARNSYEAMVSRRFDELDRQLFELQKEVHMLKAKAEGRVAEVTVCEVSHT